MAWTLRIARVFLNPPLYMAELTVVSSMLESAASTLSFRTILPMFPSRFICFVDFHLLLVFFG